MMQKAAAAIERFFFAPMPPYTMAAFRIAYALLVLWYALLLLPDYFVWFGNKGVLSLATAQSFSHICCIQLLNIVPLNDTLLAAFFYILIVADVFLLLGKWTKTSAFIVFICLASFLHRNPFIIDSGDVLLPIAAFHLMLSPAGMVWSIDSRKKRQDSQNTPESDAQPEPITCEPWVQRLYQLQICFLYFTAVRTKLMSPSWLSGDELYYVLNSGNLRHLPVPFLAANPQLCMIGTWASLLIECALFSLIWVPRLRYYVIAAGLALHLGIDYAMNLPVFQWLMMASLLTFVEPLKLKAAVDKWSRRRKLGASAAQANL